MKKYFDYSIFGGASTFLKYFELNYEAKVIIRYANLQWSV